MTWSFSAMDLMISNWRRLLPQSRHARATLQELANIANFAENKSSDLPLNRIEFGSCQFSDLYPTIISWLSKEVCGITFTYLSG
jgi:hypothetical protein